MESIENKAIQAQADLHHQYFLGLQLMVAVEESKQTVFDWTFRLFRKQHEEKFLSSFSKLGLDGLPDAVACAKYHVLSNGMGGVAVEYMPESDTKAWVRFRYPRWMYAGPAICGIPMEAGRGFLHGWYAQNGVSLENPRLGFVCVSEDVTGQFGLCGYFKEYDRDLSPDERLIFAPDERTPLYDANAQPAPPQSEWNELRLLKANRNYAVEYIRNGIAALIEVVGEARAEALAAQAARLTGLQHYSVMAAATGAVDGGVEDAAHFLVRMFSGMGDKARVIDQSSAETKILHEGFRVGRGMSGPARSVLYKSWTSLWQGAISSHRAPMSLTSELADKDGITVRWTIKAA